MWIAGGNNIRIKLFLTQQPSEFIQFIGSSGSRQKVMWHRPNGQFSLINKTWQRQQRGHNQLSFLKYMQGPQLRDERSGGLSLLQLTQHRHRETERSLKRLPTMFFYIFPLHSFNHSFRYSAESWNRHLLVARAVLLFCFLCFVFCVHLLAEQIRF